MAKKKSKSNDETFNEHMFMRVSSPYWFSEKSLPSLEERVKGTYIGFWSIKDSNNNWTDFPLDVFYVSNPDTEKGHGHYPGFYVKGEEVYIADCTSAFKEPAVGMLCEDGEIMISRYRHHYVEKDGNAIDGGRDYLRVSGNPKLVNVRVVDGSFVFELPKNEQDN